MEGLFPHGCSNCGRAFATLRDYIRLTRPLGATISYDAEVGDWAPVLPLGTALLANCLCGTTLSLTTDGLPLPTRHRLLALVKAEVASRAFLSWARLRGITLDFIRPGKPTDNAYIESFNGKFRDECLNEQYFLTLDDARMRIERWRQHYNRVRPHSALHHQPPAVYAKQFFNQPGPELRVLKQG